RWFCEAALAPTSGHKYLYSWRSLRSLFRRAGLSGCRFESRQQSPQFLCVMSRQPMPRPQHRPAHAPGSLLGTLFPAFFNLADQVGSLDRSLEQCRSRLEAVGHLVGVAVGQQTAIEQLQALVAGRQTTIEQLQALAAGQQTTIEQLQALVEKMRLRNR